MIYFRTLSLQVDIVNIITFRFISRKAKCIVFITFFHLSIHLLEEYFMSTCFIIGNLLGSEIHSVMNRTLYLCLAACDRETIERMMFAILCDVYFNRQKHKILSPQEWYLTWLVFKKSFQYRLDQLIVFQFKGAGATRLWDEMFIT